MPLKIADHLLNNSRLDATEKMLGATIEDGLKIGEPKSLVIDASAREAVDKLASEGLIQLPGGLPARLDGMQDMVTLSVNVAFMPSAQKELEFDEEPEESRTPPLATGEVAATITVGAERFQEITDAYSADGLAKKKPVARAVLEIDGRHFVCVGISAPGEPPQARLVECASFHTIDEQFPGVPRDKTFTNKADKQNWIIINPGATIAVTPTAEIIDVSSAIEPPAPEEPAPQTDEPPQAEEPSVTGIRVEENHLAWVAKATVDGQEFTLSALKVDGDYRLSCNQEEVARGRLAMPFSGDDVRHALEAHLATAQGEPFAEPAPEVHPESPADPEPEEQKALGTHGHLDDAGQTEFHIEFADAEGTRIEVKANVAYNWTPRADMVTMHGPLCEKPPHTTYLKHDALKDYSSMRDALTELARTVRNDFLKTHAATTA